MATDTTLRLLRILKPKIKRVYRELGEMRVLISQLEDELGVAQDTVVPPDTEEDTGNGTDEDEQPDRAQSRNARRAPIPA